MLLLYGLETQVRGARGYCKLFLHIWIQVCACILIFFTQSVLDWCCSYCFCSLQRHNTKKLKQIFPEKELHGQSTNSYIYVYVSDLYTPTIGIGLPILLQEKRWTDHGNIYTDRSHTHEVEFGTEAPEFLFWEHINRNFFAVLGFFIPCIFYPLATHPLDKASQGWNVPWMTLHPTGHLSHYHRSHLHTKITRLKSWHIYLARRWKSCTARARLSQPRMYTVKN